MLAIIGGTGSYARRRGDGLCERSIAALQVRNALGYRKPGPGLVLNLYDRDVNQMLDLAELLRGDIDGAPIAIADHGYGCTAGQGSSGGALA